MGGGNRVQDKKVTPFCKPNDMRGCMTVLLYPHRYTTRPPSGSPGGTKNCQSYKGFELP